MLGARAANERLSRISRVDTSLQLHAQHLLKLIDRSGDLKGAQQVRLCGEPIPLSRRGERLELLLMIARMYGQCSCVIADAR